MSVRTYSKHFSTKQTPQSEAIPNSSQVPNSAGGFAWAVDDWTRLDRFLILGSEGGSYYASERKLTIENAKAVQRCLEIDGIRVVKRIVEISDSGRAPKNDAAIFALAMAMGTKGKSQEFYLEVQKALPKVCRIGTHLFQFVESVQNFRGWGRSLRNAISHWYRDQDNLAYQVSKYQQRDGWSNRDLLRLSHAIPKDETDQIIYNWVVKGWEGVGNLPHPNPALLPIWAMEKAKRSTSKKEVIKLITDYNLVREHIPTQFLNDAEVWEALLQKMPMMAMIRNLATMTRAGLITPLSPALVSVVSRLTDQNLLKKARIHPIAILAAMKTYEQGHGERGHNTWNPVSQVIDALDKAFYLSFGNVESTGKRWLLALDVSSSMGFGTIAGIPGMDPRTASSALALITAAVEPMHAFVGFTNGGACARASQWLGYQTGLTPLAISPRQRLTDVISYVASLPMGGTDCALPMIYAKEQKMLVDCFVILTDSETWANPETHPSQALEQYRDKMGIPAKMIVVGMVSNGFSIANPDDKYQLDVVGFDSSVPQLMSDFCRE